MMHSPPTVTNAMIQVRYDSNRQPVETYVVDTTDIKKDEAICLAYGASYWNRYMASYQCSPELRFQAESYYANEQNVDEEEEIIGVSSDDSDDSSYDET